MKEQYKQLILDTLYHNATNHRGVIPLAVLMNYERAIQAINS